MYRSQEEAAKALSGATTVIADFADPASLDRALEGIESVFLVCSPVPQLVELEGNVVRACQKNGVRHLVQATAFGAGQFDKSFPKWHYSVEELVRASGIPATILRPESFMQNIASYYAGTIRSDRAFYAAGKDVPGAFVDLRDVAAVAASVLLEKIHTGAVYNLTGGEALSHAKVAERISSLLGTPVAYVDLSIDQLKQAMAGLGMPPWRVEALADLQTVYTDGPGTSLSPDVRRVLGREPILFTQFLQDCAGHFATPTAIT
jgi:uncharacterized protein YbjT (DUF2867 family)